MMENCADIFTNNCHWGRVTTGVNQREFTGIKKHRINATEQEGFMSSSAQWFSI